MNRKTLIAVAGTAALAFGSAAHAIEIDSESSVTYAKETLLKTDKTVGGVTYYVLAPLHTIKGSADITANKTDGSDYEVLFSLQNMVFKADAKKLEAQSTDKTRTVAGFTHHRGGVVDDNFVVFRKTGGQGEIKATDTLTLTAEFAVTADGPGGITRVVTNKALPSSLPNIQVSMTHTNPDAVKVMRVLKETVTPSLPIADASDDFMSFTGGTAVSRNLQASVGSLTISVESGVRDARITDPEKGFVTLTAVQDGKGNRIGGTSAGIIASGVLDASSAGSAVTFSGEFSFLDKLALDSTTEKRDCSGGALTEIRKPNEDDRTILLDETMPKDAGTFSTGAALCVVVDGETAIPKTGAYMVTTEYKGPLLNMFPPVGGTHNLAAIGRSGSTFHLPFLTVNERFNQRVTIANRGRATTYSLGELATIGHSVSALDMASGDLPPGQTVLKVSELIEVMGAMRASGTLSMPADASSLDVSIDLVNRENGAADTVYVNAAD